MLRQLTPRVAELEPVGRAQAGALGLLQDRNDMFEAALERHGRGVGNLIEAVLEGAGVRGHAKKLGRIKVSAASRPEARARLPSSRCSKFVATCRGCATIGNIPLRLSAKQCRSSANTCRSAPRRQACAALTFCRQACSSGSV